MNLIEKQNKTQIMFPPEIRDYLGIKYLVKHEFKTKISLTKQYKTPSSQHILLKKNHNNRRRRGRRKRRREKMSVREMA